MNDLALARYLQTCCRRLDQQQTALIDHFSLRTCTAIEIQQDKGLMKLAVPGRGQAIATVTPIARYCPSSQNWRWAWANSATFPLRHHSHHSATALQSLGNKTGLNLFTSAQLTLELEQVSLVLAMACSRLKASGCYRWRAGDESVLLAINHLALTTSELEASGNGDRLQLSQIHGERRAEQSQGNQLVRLSPAAGSSHSSPASSIWPNQRSLEGLFIHTLCRGQLANVEGTLAALKSLGCQRSSG